VSSDWDASQQGRGVVLNRSDFPPVGRGFFLERSAISDQRSAIRAKSLCPTHKAATVGRAGESWDIDSRLWPSLTRHILLAERCPRPHEQGQENEIEKQKRFPNKRQAGREPVKGDDAAVRHFQQDAVRYQVPVPDRMEAGRPGNGPGYPFARRATNGRGFVGVSGPVRSRLRPLVRTREGASY